MSKRPAAHPAISSGDELLSVDEALKTIIAAAAAPRAGRISIEAGLSRVLARDVAAAIDQPPFRASAMDGYAVRFADMRVGASLALIGEAAAGAPFPRDVAPGEAVRIFTGGAVPKGADHVVIQEDVAREGDRITVNEDQRAPANIREAGIDFRCGDRLKKKGERLAAIDLGLIASANVASIDVFRKPNVAFFDNGDELREPGSALRHGEIVGSNRFALEAMIAEWGGVPVYLGRAGDDPHAIRIKFEQARDADILVAIGGASVGDRDHVRSAFAAAGGEIMFSKIAVRPGKPTWFGRLGETRLLGLPGNPASAVVCAILFLRPLIMATAGERFDATIIRAAAADALKANGPRETYLRGRIAANDDGRLIAHCAGNQDSSLFSPLVAGNCLIRRAAGAAETAQGELVDCLLYAPLDA